jgi:hypothetical protein
MKRKYIITITLTAVVILFSLGMTHLYALSADNLCGNPNPCPISDFKVAISNTLLMLVSFATLYMLIKVLYRGGVALAALSNGNENSYIAAKKETGNALLGFLIFVLIAGGIASTIFGVFGLKPVFFNFLSEIFIDHAYASGTTTVNTFLPNPLIGVSDIYDFLGAVLRILMSFIVYPVIIMAWVWSGFSYVIAQGNPEALTKTHRRFLIVVILTIAIFLSKSVLTVIGNTAKLIIPNKTQYTQPVSTNGLDNINQPVVSPPSSFVSDNGLTNVGQANGAICYSNSNCASGRCALVGDKGTCQPSLVKTQDCLGHADPAWPCEKNTGWCWVNFTFIIK